MIVAYFLAALASVPGPNPSLLVDDDHEHDWRPIRSEGDPQPFGWLDEGWRGELEFEGETYPLILVRMSFGDEQIDSDSLYLVHCELGQLGLYRVLRFSAKDLNELLTLTRVNMKDSEDALDNAIVNQACSNDQQ